MTAEMTAVNRIIIALSSLMLTACSASTIYSRFLPIPSDNWDADSVLSYTMQVDNNDTPYDIILCVRHTETYPYQNMWLFCTFGKDDTIAQPVVDTLEFYLADDRGRWLGNGGLKHIEMPVLFERGYQFPDTGRYVMTIRHGMRDQQLRGISDVGVIVRQSE